MILNKKEKNMKYKVELEFEVNENYSDEFIENGDYTVEHMADYAISNNLSKYGRNVCDAIGFPGTMDVIKYSRED